MLLRSQSISFHCARSIFRNAYFLQPLFNGSMWLPFWQTLSRLIVRLMLK